MEELRRAQRDYATAFANVLALAKQCGLDHPTVERLLHALTLGRAADSLPEARQAAKSDTLADRPSVARDDRMQAALQSAALAFQQVVDAVHKVGVPAIA